MPPESSTNFYGHLLADPARNRDLIDCYLSGQISERQWMKHLDAEPGLLDAWVDRKYVGGPRLTVEHVKRTISKHPALAVPYGRGLQENTIQLDEIAVAQRKLSPRFPTIAEATERRTALRETIIARTLLGLTVGGLIYSVWDRSGFGLAGASFVGFVITCFVAGNRRHGRSGGGGFPG